MAKYLQTAENSVHSTAKHVTKHQQAEVLQHITDCLGPISQTIGEATAGGNVQINIHIIYPSDERNYITLVTSGMSDGPIDESEKGEKYKYAELLLKLPANWPINQWKDDKCNWPIHWLRRLAILPHLHEGWLNEYVTIPNGEPPQPLASNTQLSCIILCRALDPGLDRLPRSDGFVINFYTLVPIYSEERTIANNYSRKFFLECYDKN
ncbi:suppressor of fused domain protein, partial [Paenibacillus algorifonticola]|uniref:suppressor of fused domain protein n=1 Tax=Paenibacillus algorifonticola TaxID=684063 RepID=UPI003D2CD156